MIERTKDRPDSQVLSRFKVLYEDNIITKCEYKELDKLNDEEEAAEKLKKYNLEKFKDR